MEVDPAQLMQRLKSQLRRRGLRPLPFFRDFDRLNSGRITAQQFVRGLGGSGFAFSPAEAEALCAKYVAPNDPRLVLYNAFCDDVLGVAKDLERQPCKQVEEQVVKAHPLNEVDSAVHGRLDALANEMRRTISARGLNVLLLFQDFDKKRTGYVTEAQFRRCLKNEFPLLREQNFEDVFAKFRWREDDDCGDAVNLRGKINYTAFCDSLVQLKPEKFGDSFNFTDGNDAALAGSHSDPFTVDKPEIEKSSCETVDDVEDHIRAQMLRLRARPLDLLRSKDPRRTGFLAAPQVRNTLGMLGLTMADPDYALLKERYTTPRGFKYIELCKALEQVFAADIALAGDPAEAGVSAPGIATRAAALPSYYAKLANADVARADAIEQRLGRHVRAKRLLIAPTFRDFDRSNKQVITEAHFRRSLSHLALPMSEEEVNLLIRRYATRGVDGSSGVRYGQFVRAVDEPMPYDTTEEEVRKRREDRKKQAEMQRALVAGHEATDEGVDVDALLGRIQQHAVTRRVRVGAFFQDFDKLRKGAVTATQFRTTLGQVGVAVTDEEFAALRKRYPSDKVPNGVAWSQFVAEVSTAETVAGLERNPTAEVKVAKYEYRAAKHIAGRDALPEPMKPHLDAVLDRLRKHVWARELLVDVPFKRFDRLNKGRVTQAQFKAAMTYIALVPIPTEVEVEALLACFAVPGTEYVSYAALVDKANEILKDENGKPRVRTQYQLGVHPEEAVHHVEVKREEVVVKAEDVVENIRIATRRRRVRIGDFFRDFDPLHHGHIAASKVATVMGASTVTLSEAELAALVAAYVYKPDPTRVAYRQLVVDIDGVPP